MPSTPAAVTDTNITRRHDNDAAVIPNSSSWYIQYLLTLRRQHDYTVQAEGLREELISTHIHHLQQSSQRARDIAMSGKHTMGKLPMPRVLKDQLVLAGGGGVMATPMKLPKSSASMLSSSPFGHKVDASGEKPKALRRQLPFQDHPNELLREGSTLQYPKFPFQLSYHDHLGQNRGNINKDQIVPAVSPFALQKRYSLPTLSQSKNSNSNNNSVLYPSVGDPEYRVQNRRRLLSEKDQREPQKTAGGPTPATSLADTPADTHGHPDPIKIPYATEQPMEHQNHPGYLPPIYTKMNSITGAQQAFHTAEPFHVPRVIVVPNMGKYPGGDDEEEGEDTDSSENASQKQKRNRVHFALDLVTQVVLPKNTSSKRRRHAAKKHLWMSKNGGKERPVEIASEQTTDVAMATTNDINNTYVQEETGITNDLNQTQENVDDQEDAELEALGKKYVEKMKRRASYKQRQRRSVQLTVAPTLAGMISIVDDDSCDKGSDENRTPVENSEEVAGSDDLCTISEYTLTQLSPLVSKETRQTSNDRTDVNDNITREIHSLVANQESNSSSSQQLIQQNNAKSTSFFPPITSRYDNYQT